MTHARRVSVAGATLITDDVSCQVLHILVGLVVHRPGHGTKRM